MIQRKKTHSEKKGKTCYCAFCRSERRMPPRPHINGWNIAGAIVASVSFMLLIWRDFDARVLVLFVSFIGVAECFLRIRWRIALPCRYCGFDPALYIRKPQAAAEKVRLHMEKRQADPMVLFSRNPKLNIPVRRMRGGELVPTVQKRGTILSKSI